MKVLVFSDSHGNVQNMLDAVEIVQPDALIHLGDGWRDAQEVHDAYPALPLEQVPGNCDMVFGEPLERLIFLGNVPILLCHGHTLGVKRDPLRAAYAACERGAKVVLYGHTHLVCNDEHNGLLLFNPGSIGDYFHPYYGVLTIENGVCHGRTYPLRER